MQSAPPEVDELRSLRGLLQQYLHVPLCDQGDLAVEEFVSQNPVPACPMFPNAPLPMSPTRYLEKDLNLSPEYASTITGFNGVRELMQNWKDQCVKDCASLGVFQRGCTCDVLCGVMPGVSGCPDGSFRLLGLYDAILGTGLGYTLECLVMEGGRPQRTVRLVNFNAHLKDEHFILGVSDKGAGAAGCYGEGMKVEINRLTSAGVRIFCQSGSTAMCFRHQHPPSSSTRQSLFKVSSPYPGGFISKHTTFVLDLTSSQTPFMNARDLLYLHPRASPISDGVLEVLLEPLHHSRIYVKDLFVQEESRLPRMGLNYLGPPSTYAGLGFGRDRNCIRVKPLIACLPRLATWLHSQGQVDSCISLVHAIFEGLMVDPHCALREVIYWTDLGQPDSTQPNFFPNLFLTFGFCDYAASQLNRGNLEVRSACDVLPVSNSLHTRTFAEEQKKDAGYLGFECISVSEPILEILRESPFTPTLDSLRAKRASFIVSLPEWPFSEDPERLFAASMAEMARHFFEPIEILFKHFPSGNEKMITRVGDAQFVVDGSWLFERPRGQKVHIRMQKEGQTCSGGQCGCMRYLFLEDLLQEAPKERQQKLRQAIMRESLSAMSNTLRADTSTGSCEAVFPQQGPSRERQSYPDVLPQENSGRGESSASPGGRGADGGASLPTLDVTDAEGDPGGLQDSAASASPGRVPRVARDAAESELDVTAEKTVDLSVSAAALVQGCMQRVSGEETGRGLEQVREQGGADRPPELLADTNCIPTCDLQRREVLVDGRSVSVFVERGNLRDWEGMDRRVRGALLRDFSELLFRLGSGVFLLPGGGLGSSVHIFWQDDGGLIAFNRGGSLFFNLRFFKQQVEKNMEEALKADFWFVSFCHGLAHNEATAHGREHQRAMEALVVSFNPNFFKLRMALVQEGRLTHN
uniref:Uncharacterized protein n=1 Tax=Chromera velia CCMP2878 TaxID=1169474 RepID=A0A0G4IG08_9ALVE|eukprot:Cvel_14095.t1-p1 / transcript=Cvel_14095.t1 / gene=Cvel_14095 / organism=Chromera_velia_CCMP2878 / gene_product=hypothetical protein / transcript_product=hypothetical protein / location=Cvel_scaffold990:44612-48205(+) / protein_length=919 / sequence_SO=supercontig / SO=protein_coding / is_pseudo=false